MGVAIEILKDFEEEYRIPIINDKLITEHIRPYNPDKPMTSAFGEQFRLRPNKQNLDSQKNIFIDNENIILSLIKRSYDLATTHRDKIMKVYDEKHRIEKATEDDMVKQKLYLNRLSI